MTLAARRLVAACLALCWGLADAAIGQGLPRAEPREVGLSAERLTRLDRVVESFLARGEIPGAVLLVARRGRVAYFRSFGMMDVEAGRAMQPDAIFRLASMTKIVTSVAVMMLYEEGRFLLEDPVARYLPAFAEPRVLVPGSAEEGGGEAYHTVPAEGPITIRQLLSHTSGLSYRLMNREHLSDLYRDAGVSDLVPIDATTGEMVDKLAALPLLHQPGEAWEYSLSTDVLGRLIEVVSGMTLEEFFEKRIFAPLEMVDSHFYIPSEKLPRLVAAYMPGPEGGLVRWPETTVENGHLVFSASYPYSERRTYFSGGGGLSGSTADFARFLQMLLGGGELDGVRLLGPRTIAFMGRNHVGDLVPFIGGDGYKFGLGFLVHEDPGRTGILGSPGDLSWGGAFYTRFWIDPREDFFGLLMSQVFPSDHIGLWERFRVLVYQAIVDSGH